MARLKVKQKGGGRRREEIVCWGLSIMTAMLTLLQRSPGTATSPLHQKVKNQRSACQDLQAAIFLNHLWPSVFVFFSRRPGRRPSDETTISDPNRPACFSTSICHGSVSNRRLSFQLRIAQRRAKRVRST